MKNWLAGGVALVVAVALALPNVADAKRVGGGKNAGMQRSAPAQQAPNSAQGTPAQPAAPQNAAPSPATAPAAAGATATAATATAATAKRSWMGPIAGLAAGIGLAALASHLGFGDELANFVMIALLAVLAVVVIRFLMRRFAGNKGMAASGPQLAGAGAPAGGLGMPANAGAADPAMQRQAWSPAQPAQPAPASTGGAPAGFAPGSTPVAAAPMRALPDGMDAADFTRLAKQVFIRMQAANDAGDAEDLRRFTTPELFASLKADLLERAGAKQQTDVVQLDAEVVDVAQEDGRDIVSVRFWGLVREQAEAGADAFNEVWHLVRPSAGGDWAIAGITPVQ